MQLGTYTIDGGPLLYDEQFGTFEVGGKTVTADRVRELDHLEKIVWSGETSRAWFHSAFPGTVPAAPTAVASPGKPKSTAIGCGILLVLVVAASLGLSTCSSKSAAPKADVAVLRASTLNAINAMPDIAGGVYGVEAYENGNVAVRLKFTKEAIGGIEGEQKVTDVAGGIANLVFAKVPEAAFVAVYDANGKRIGNYTRP